MLGKGTLSTSKSGKTIPSINPICASITLVVFRSHKNETFKLFPSHWLPVIYKKSNLSYRAVDLDSVFADPHPAVHINADPDPAAFLMRIRIQPNKICNKLLHED